MYQKRSIRKAICDGGNAWQSWITAVSNNYCTPLYCMDANCTRKQLKLLLRLLTVGYCRQWWTRAPRLLLCSQNGQWTKSKIQSCASLLGRRHILLTDLVAFSQAQALIYVSVPFQELWTSTITSHRRSHLITGYHPWCRCWRVYVEAEGRMDSSLILRRSVLNIYYNFIAGAMLQPLLLSVLHWYVGN